MARRQFNVFNLSFLDIMACGFGAVVLFFMIISAQVAVRADTASEELLGETNRMEEEVLEGRKNLVRLKTQVDKREQQFSELQDESDRLARSIEELTAQLTEFEQKSLASRESVEQLQADIERLEAARQRLLAEADKSGERVRSFTGEGNRQYLSGMRMGGKRILILVDASASMLGRTYVNVIRYRNMGDDLKLRTPKWRSTIDAVDWITSQVPPASKFQVMAFNTQVTSVVPQSNGDWVEVGDGSALTAAVNRLRITVPQSGSSLYRAFEAINKMDPRPDNIFLLTDGLPTQGANPPAKEEIVTGQKRLKFFNEAVALLSRSIPVNIMLYPMDGDPDAAGYFWQMALETQGSFMSPSEDWP